jgi:hypothetical protein
MAYPLRGSDRSRRCCADVGSDDRIRNPKLSNVATARKQRGSFDRSFGARNRDPVDRRLMPILVRLIADGHILAIPFHASRKSDGLIQGDGLERSAAVAKLQQLKGALSTEQPRRADASGSVSVALASYRRARIRRLSRRRYRRQIHKEGSAPWPPVPSTMGCDLGAPTRAAPIRRLAASRMASPSATAIRRSPRAAQELR